MEGFITEGSKVEKIDPLKLKEIGLIYDFMISARKSSTAFFFASSSR